MAELAAVFKIISGHSITRTLTDNGKRPLYSGFSLESRLRFSMYFGLTYIFHSLCTVKISLSYGETKTVTVCYIWRTNFLSIFAGSLGSVGYMQK